MRGDEGRTTEESDSDEEQEESLQIFVVLVLLLLLLLLRFRDFDRLLLLLEDLRLDDPRDEEDLLRLRPKEDELLGPTAVNFLPLTEAGDLGGRRFGAIGFVVCPMKEFDV